MLGMFRLAGEREQVVVKNTFITVIDSTSEGMSSRPRSKTEPDELFKACPLQEDVSSDMPQLEQHRGRLLSFDIPQTPSEGMQGEGDESQSFGLPRAGDSEQLQYLTNQLQTLCQENAYLSARLASSSSSFTELNATMSLQDWMPLSQACMMFPVQSFPTAGQATCPPDQTNASGLWEDVSTEASESEDAAVFEEVNSESTGSRLQGGRTTVMLRNLPNNYTRDMVLKLLDYEGFHGKFDFFYLPIDFKSNASLGYAFVNLVDTAAALEFRRIFEGYSGWSIPSQKRASISWSEPHQGLQAHIQRYRNSPLMHSSVPDECKPMIFENGIRVPFPVSSRAPRRPRPAKCTVPRVAGLQTNSSKK